VGHIEASTARLPFYKDFATACAAGVVLAGVPPLNRPPNRQGFYAKFILVMNFYGLAALF
jgi:hypothetical protein